MHMAPLSLKLAWPPHTWEEWAYLAESLFQGVDMYETHILTSTTLVP
jgi:hypothetical protein